ncbi:thiol reductant ABC exporter subunit CydC [Neobacillus sp. SM06]|uniref:thiol reductant ABC exporter subunit CydC n=1 Tax=Neobacillus sp. SM06 TaxID=3422492 RepID=UPI003D271C3E
MNKDQWIFPYLKQYRGLFLLAISLGALTVLFGAGLMFTSGYLISKAATRPESILMVYVPIVGVRTFGIGRAVISYIERLTGHQFILKILSEMRTRLYKILEPQAIFLRERFATGDLLGVLADDIEHLQDFYLKTLIPSVVSLVVYVIIIVLAGAFSIPFAILLGVLIGLLVLVGPLLSFVYLKAKNEQLKQRKSMLYRQLTDAVFGMSDWVFSGKYPDLIAKYEKNEQEWQQIDVIKQSFINWREFFSQAVLGIVVILAVYWASSQTQAGEFPATFIAAVGLVMMSLLESFLPLSGAVSEVSSYKESVDHLTSIESKNSPSATQSSVASFEEFSNISIRFANITFAYPGEASLIRDFNLEVNQGEKIAILGPSGSGKSTLLKLLQGVLSPKSGEVLLNGIRADEIESFIPEIISILNQKPYLFNTTVLNNIRLGRPDATDEEVYLAAKQAQIHELIESLPNGYETNMHETGGRFSGGERQRIALARILLQNTPVVIMDEPTVGLDPLMEQKLLETIFAALKGKTIIWVTHHLAGMSKMDRILFIDRGLITMQGTHRQLIEKVERYRRLYQLDRPF